MASHTIFVTRRISPDALHQLSLRYDVVFNEESRHLSRYELIEMVDGVEALIVFPWDTVDRHVIEAASELKIIALYGEETSNIDLAHAATKAIWVTHTPDVSHAATADLIMGVLLSLVRQIGQAQDIVRAINFHGGGPLLFEGEGLEGKILGLVGFREIGRLLAQRAQSFGMEVIYIDSMLLSRNEEEDLGVRHYHLEGLLQTADIISLQGLYPRETQVFLGRKEFRDMKEGAYLINAAHREIIDESAMIDRLESGKLAGVGLDVYVQSADLHEALRSRANVLPLPSIAAFTKEANAKSSQMVVDDVLRVLDGRKPLYPVRL